jgi:hypothetical protein
MASEDPIQLVGPAGMGRASDGTEVFHTGLWMIPSRKYLFIGLLAEGEPPARLKKPQIVVSDSDELSITDFFHGGAGGSDFGHHWVLLARMDPEQAGRLSGATLTVHYEALGLEYSAQIVNLAAQ